MKPSKQEIHPEICNEDAQEGEDAEDMEMLRIHSIAGITIYAIANGLVQMSEIEVS